MIINNKRLWSDIQKELSTQLNQTVHIDLATAVSGGDISESFILQVHLKESQKADKYFAKINRMDFLATFETEARALEFITSRVKHACPEPLLCGSNENHSYIVMQHLSLGSHSRSSPRALGELVATLHSVCNESDKPYGWEENNFIGQTPQHNQWTASWAEFFVEQRLKPQIKLARQNGFHRQLSAISSELYIAVENILQEHQPPAALLHGDLWGGNAGYDNQGKPWIYDPASYFGDPETDIAMTELFGGYSREFYDAYHEKIPQLEGYRERKTIYNLYHMLNHLNLFGSGYLAQVQRYIKLIIS